MEQITEKKKRPPAVWITQILVLLFGIWFSYSFVGVAGATLDSTEANVRRAMWALFLVLLVSILGATFWGLTKRTRWGKWLGVLILLLVWSLVVYVQLYPPSGPIKPYEYTNETQVSGGKIGNVLINFLIGLLVFRLAFSKKVNRFFQP